MSEQVAFNIVLIVIALPMAIALGAFIDWLEYLANKDDEDF